MGSMPLITGTIQDEAEALYVGPVIFENLDSPCSGGSRVNGPAITALITENDGAFPAGTRLAPGRTRLIINGKKSRTFNVPEGSGTYDLATLMSTSTLYTRVIVHAETIADLRAFQTASTNFLAYVIADANGAFAIFKWNNEADDADDDVTHIRPDDFDGAGIWIKIL